MCIYIHGANQWMTAIRSGGFLTRICITPGHEVNLLYSCVMAGPKAMIATQVLPQLPPTAVCVCVPQAMLCGKKGDTTGQADCFLVFLYRV